MSKQIWKAGNMVYPVPAVLVSTADRSGKKNIFTVAWTGNICTNPPMVYISVRPERYSYGLIGDSGEFVINLTTEKLAFATDFCGVRSGRDLDKWEQCGLHAEAASKLEYAPLITESPVNIECRVKQKLDLGSHTMFIADVLSVDVSEDFIDESGKIMLGAGEFGESNGLIVYSHGEYLTLGKTLGTFGYSVRKKPVGKAGGKRKKKQ